MKGPRCFESGDWAVGGRHSFSARLYQGVNSFASCERLRVDEVGIGWNSRLEKTCSWGQLTCEKDRYLFHDRISNHPFLRSKPIFIKFPYFFGHHPKATVAAEASLENSVVPIRSLP